MTVDQRRPKNFESTHALIQPLRFYVHSPKPQPWSYKHSCVYHVPVWYIRNNLYFWSSNCADFSFTPYDLNLFIGWYWHIPDYLFAWLIQFHDLLLGFCEATRILYIKFNHSAPQGLYRRCSWLWLQAYNTCSYTYYWVSILVGHSEPGFLWT